MIFLKLINKPIAWPHLDHMDAPLYPGKEQMISKNNAVLEQMFLAFHDKLLFAVSFYVYIAVHEIYVYRAIREHC